jgi:hypothetical protein
MQQSDEINPQVIGFAETEITVLIECPFCPELHVHGRGYPGAVGNLGFRVPHCLDRGNPQYEITEVRPLDELRRRVRPKRRSSGELL